MEGKVTISRRDWFGMAAAAGILTAAEPRRVKLPGVHIGVTDWNIGKRGSTEALELAQKVGFEGVQVSLGRTPVDGKMPLDNAEVQAQYLAVSRQTKVAICSTCLDILHVNPLKTDPLGRKWLGDAIPIAQKLGAPTMLLPLLRENAPKGAAELDQVADILKEFMPAAQKANVSLGLEDSVTAEDNARMFTRIGSRYINVFYDVGLTAGMGLDPVKEIRFLGKDRINCFHFRDRADYLGQGKIDFRAVLEAIADIGFTGWIVFETRSPTKDIEADMKKNLDYIRSLIA
jgi:sugar phosphate isomerase/epimerase